MWHPVSFVAKSNFLDIEKFQKFSDQMLAENKFGLIKENSTIEVNTWHVDDLIKTFKSCFTKEEITKQRNNAIQLMKEQNKS